MTTPLATKTNNLAVSALILSPILPVLGICLGAIALREISDSHEGGRGCAIAAVVIGSVLILAVLVAVLLCFALIVWTGLALAVDYS